MELINPSYQILHQESGLEGIYKAIELAGRICYKSEDKITDNSAKEFTDRMVKLGHWAMLEHGTVYLKVSIDHSEFFKYCKNKYSKVRIENNIYYITTNYRVLVENEWLDDLKYLCIPTEYHEKRIAVKFIADIGVLREFFRHRVFSMAQESTRYCNYSKEKFRKTLTFINPCWEMSQEAFHILKASLNIAESMYFDLLTLGWQPQQARNILPLALKSEAIMTGFLSDWVHFFKLRDDKAAHPQARELATPLHQEFINKFY
jgi:thymidylate synthase (FAD)